MNRPRPGTSFVVLAGAISDGYSLFINGGFIFEL